ncbi:MAG: hypothetical protein AAFV98_00290 [Chloroflexota bacterium]
MARRRTPNKSKAEAKVERRTWLALAAVFIALSVFDPENQLPDYAIAFTISGILLTSGMYQFIKSDDNQSWRVSPITWIVASILGIFATYYLLSDLRGWLQLPLDLRLISLGATYTIIILGILTNEQ